MYRTQSRDTYRALEDEIFERCRRMTVDEKLEHVSALGRLAEEVALAALRARYPEATERENRLRLASRWLDRETLIRVYDWDPNQEGR